MVKQIERECAAALREGAGHQYDPMKMQAIIEALAAELCSAAPPTGDKADS
jgi:hypothetical protein